MLEALVDPRLGDGGMWPDAMAALSEQGIVDPPRAAAALEPWRTGRRIDWASQSIAFSVDGTVYRTIRPGSLPAGAAWVFDRPFFLILNVAVGGTFPGNPNATTQFPQEMIVDYVRVTGAS